MIIAFDLDGTTRTQAYLQLLKDALENGKLTSEQLRTILVQQNKKGRSVGMNIVCYSVGMDSFCYLDAATIQAYLQLLKNALENGKLTSEQLTRILTQQDKNGWSVGMFIARYRATTTQAYLQLLKNAIENEKLTSEQFTMLLMQQNKNGSSIGMHIARFQDAAITQQYLQLLKDALENRKLTSEELTTLLMQQDKEGASVGMFIPRYRATTTQAYLQL